MGWFEKFKKSKAPEEPKKVRTVIPHCSKCSEEIQNLNVSIGEAIEDQGAFVYSGSEGHLYEPMFDGVICTSCGTMLCDQCLSEQVDETLCPKCGGTLRTITLHRLPKAE